MEAYYAELELFRDSRKVSAGGNPPTYPTPEEVMTLATKFKAFVDGDA
jgi:hypothetical protein